MVLREWGRDTDRRRFAEQVAAGWRGPRTGGLADRRAQIWSPLARQFADLGRDVLAPPTLRGVLDRVVATAAHRIPRAELAVLTLTRPGLPLCTAAGSGAGGGPDPRAAELDAAQNAAGQGPFHDAAGQDGPGAVRRRDLAAWPEFAAAAAEHGLRGVLCAGVFPVGGTARGALAVYAPRPWPAGGPEADEVLVLACCAAAALGTTRAVTPAEVDRAEIAAPVRSAAVIERAVAVLVDRRGLGPGESYDLLRRAATALTRG